MSFAMLFISLVIGGFLIDIWVKLRDILLHLQAPYSQNDRNVEYITVAKHPDDAHEFSEEINEMIKDGWKPQGGIAILHNGGWVQAMVKVTYH